MRCTLLIGVLLTVAVTASAADITDVSRPEKPNRPVPANVPGPRQGGEDIASAVPITLPLIDQTGTTTGYHDDYDECCPYTASDSPDVVYTFTPDVSTGYDFDMYGSAYDTKIYIYDEDLYLVACNDDFYHDYTSYLEDVPCAAGMQYYLVIDGYGGMYGDYLLNITEFVPCVVDIPGSAVLEGEPEIVDGYVDEFNGGCNSNPVVYSVLDATAFHGKSGYYLDADGWTGKRDLDWFEVTLPEGGMVEIIGDAVEAVNLYQIEGPCDDLVVENGGVAGPCSEFTLTITGDAGEVVRVLVGATRFWEGETYEYDYLLLTDLPWPISVEQSSWTDVRSLFD